jgi:GNAT superfamily N-acetyltransferase
MSGLTEAFYRRLYAFHKPTPEEFYDASQPRDKRGRWSSMGGRTGKTKKLAEPTTNKMWTGVSAHPDRRKAPKSNVTFPVERGDYEDTQGQANRRFAREIFDTDLGGGYASKVSQVTVYDNKEMSVQGIITYKGKEVGTFDRAITVEKRGKVAVDHTELMIHAAHRSKGLADRFNAHAVAKYQEMGVDRITLHAGDEVGGFAWARQGFRWSTPEGGRKVAERALGIIEAQIKYSPRLRDDKGVQAEVKAVRKALKAGEDVQPIHIASIGERIKWESQDELGNRYMNWPGKAAMMRSSWEGTYYFDANEAVTAAASSLEHARLRPQFRAAPAKRLIKNEE